MRERRGRRTLPSFGYIGSGNKTAVFNRRPKSPFTVMKNLYGEELERMKSKYSKKDLNFKKLTKEERLQIRNRINEELKLERIKILITLVAVVLIILMLIGTTVFV